MTAAGWSETALRDVAQAAVEHVRTLGRAEVAATARAGDGVRVTVRDGTADTAVREGTQMLSITVLRDGRRGIATTAALDTASIRQAAREAFAISGAVLPDPDAGLADTAWLAHDAVQPPTFAPTHRSPGELLDVAMQLNAVTAAQPTPANVALSVAEAGGAVHEMRFAIATSHGFCRSASFSQHARWVMAKAQGVDGAVVEATNTVDRRLDALDPIETLAQHTVGRAVMQLGERTLSSRRAPVLLDARIAAALVGDIVAALSGGTQHRRATILLDAIGKPVAAPHIDLNEDPFEPFGLASGAFDSEGVGGTARAIIDGGTARGYFLDTLSARRLGMRSTGNAGGPWNLRLTSRTDGGNAGAMRQRMDTGLIVTGLKGGNTDLVTGTWTRAVSGLWVEGGNIVHPVTDVTIGGSLGDMLMRIVAVGDDVYRSGAIRTGSILIDTLQIAGAA